MSDVLRIVKRHKLLFAASLVVIVALVALFFYRRPGETLVASGVVSVSANSVTRPFSHTGAAVNQSMTVGCNVPASMKIICQSLVNTGTITVHINDESYATGTVTDPGDVMLSSGCGCSTVCICEIKIGDNTIRISSNDFEGELRYEIYVAS